MFWNACVAVSACQPDAENLSQRLVFALYQHWSAHFIHAEYMRDACVCPGASSESATNQVRARTFTFRPAIRHDDAWSSCACTCSTSGHAVYTQTPTCVYFTFQTVCINCLAVSREHLRVRAISFWVCLWFVDASNDGGVSWCTCTTD